jgi:hypothetical protein
VGWHRQLHADDQEDSPRHQTTTTPFVVSDQAQACCAGAEMVHHGIIDRYLETGRIHLTMASKATPAQRQFRGRQRGPRRIVAAVIAFG